MKALGCKAAAWIGIGLSVLLSACGGGGGGYHLTLPPVTYVLMVNSTNPSSGVAITVSPNDVNNDGNGTTSFTRTYDSGATVTLSAPATASGNPFSSWSGCTSASTVTCTVTMSSNTTVTANYTQSAITSVTVAPNSPTATIGTQVQFTATVAGTGNFSTTVTWEVRLLSSWTGSIGSISSSGLYETPYPAPAYVTVTATSTQDTTKSGSATVTLQPPAAAAGPALTVDVGNQTHAISPYIYGMDAYGFVNSVDGAANPAVLRWGGDNTSRYNYSNGNTNSASDYYFENQSSVAGMPGTPEAGEFNDLVSLDQSIGAITLGTVPVLGWVANNTATACSFPVSTYPDQQEVSPDGRGCGNGVLADGSDITGNNPDVTSNQEGPAWAGQWVSSLVNTFGTAASGHGVAIYDLDNEPSWWDAVHRDVHPLPFTYDEVTNNGIQTALAIKTADPTAQVSGPVMDYWWDYFYSKLDVESGWSSGSPCYEPWSNPVDREAHGGAPFIEYYLQQFAAYENTNAIRLLDYLDLHTYFAADYNGSSVAFTTAGDTGEQEARLNSTRVFWDPTYTDPNYPQPNYITDPNHTTSCSPPAQAPQLIPMMQTWVAEDYPGTKTAITEYNWGGQEHINGALAQADILGIFGEYGLDLGTLWGAPDASQVPGLMAFEIYRNYDGNGSKFGDEALASTSKAQSQLSVYGALRSTDQAVTVVVINKTYGDLTATLSLDNLTPNGSAQVFLYSNANLGAIVAQPPLTVTPPSGGGTASTISTTFPAQSITLLVVPQ
ncbi:MAG: glycoside hydrolase family 44 protein [Terriglobia bacterium]